MLPSKQKYFDYLLEKELAYPSLIILQDVISDFFIEKNGRNTSAFPNHASDLVWPSVEVVDIVFFGDALHALAGVTSWPRTIKYRIWLLCHDMKTLISELYDIPEEYLAVIPRYTVFPITNTLTSLNVLKKEDIHFVMSSSYAISKNIGLTVGVVNKIQETYPNKNIKLSICGPKPEEFMAKDEINKYEWKVQPQILGDLGFNWHTKFSPDTVMINFSTNLFEDFGISLTQAQQRGLPLIISDWGAHHDIQGSNVIKVPTKTHGLHISPESDLEERILNTTNFIVESLKNDFPESVTVPSDSLSPPTTIDINKLITCSKIFNNKHYDDVMELYKSSWYKDSNSIAQAIEHHFD
jgi:hypothetical protein